VPSFTAVDKSKTMRWAGRGTQNSGDNSFYVFCGNSAAKCTPLATLKKSVVKGNK